LKKGLVMEGGAMRGMFTAGVTDVMMERGIRFDGAVGVSAGAAFGCNYKSGQIGRAIRYNVNYGRDWRYCSLRSLILDGNLYSKRFCYGTVPKELDIFDFEAFDKNPMEFHVVCTDVMSGKPVYKKYDGNRESFFDWIRASASMPLVSEVVEVEGYRLLDGGVSDSVPLRYFEQIGYDRNVVILTQPKGYQKHENKLMPLIRIVLRKYPGIVESLEKRHLMYNAEIKYIEEKEKNGEILVIRPDSPLPVERIEKRPERLKMAYESGRNIAEKRMNEILEFLGD